jgi:hypothetical protein
MTLISNRSSIPDAILDAFNGRASLPFPETAAALGMDPKTLRQHVKVGNIGYIAKGLGTKRPRREFRLADIEAFYARISRLECPSTNVTTRHSITSTSKCEVYDFMDRQNRPRSEKPKGSKKTSGKRP